MRAIFFVTLLLTGASAQSSYTSAASSAQQSRSLADAVTSTSTAPSTTYTVTVGRIPFAFAPDTIIANVGDVVEWDFYPLNHSVVRAAYGFPCIPYENTAQNRTGFFSGIHLLDNGIPDPVCIVREPVRLNMD